MKKIAIGTLVLLALGALVWTVGFRRKESSPKYRTSKVDVGSITQTVSATGTLSAVTTVKVGSVVSGIVAAFRLKWDVGR